MKQGIGDCIKPRYSLEGHWPNATEAMAQSFEHARMVDAGQRGFEFCRLGLVLLAVFAKRPTLSSLTLCVFGEASYERGSLCTEFYARFRDPVMLDGSLVDEADQYRYVDALHTEVLEGYEEEIYWTLHGSEKFFPEVQIRVTREQLLPFLADPSKADGAAVITLLYPEAQDMISKMEALAIAVQREQLLKDCHLELKTAVERIRLHVAENQGQVLSAWLPDAQRLVQALDQLMPAAGHNLTTEAA